MAAVTPNTRRLKVAGRRLKTVRQPRRNQNYKSAKTPRILTRIEELKLLSKLEEMGVLSMMEKNGMDLKFVEENRLLSRAESSGVLSMLADRSCCEDAISNNSRGNNYSGLQTPHAALPPSPTSRYSISSKPSQAKNRSGKRLRWYSAMVLGGAGHVKRRTPTTMRTLALCLTGLAVGLLLVVPDEKGSLVYAQGAAAALMLLGALPLQMGARFVSQLQR